MTRKYIDCREYPSEMNCSVALSADSEDEFQKLASQGRCVAVFNDPDDSIVGVPSRSLWREN